MQATGAHLNSRGFPALGSLSCGSQNPGQNQQAWRVPTLQMGIQPEKRKTRKNYTGESVFQETDPFSLFSGLLKYLLLRIETNGNFKVTRGSAVLTFIKIRCFILMYTKRSQGFYVISWPGGLLTFYDPFFLIMVSQLKNLFSRGDFS